MSLEQTIADLVAASNNLTGTINTKMNEIDQKVDQATESVPNTIRELSEQRLYVDSVNGSDTNDGSPGNPLKSLYKALSLHVSGSSTNIFLKEGQTFSETGFSPVVASGKISVSRWGSTGGVSNPVVHHTPLYNAERELNESYPFRVMSGSVLFGDIHFKIENADNGHDIDGNHGLFYTYRSDFSMGASGCSFDLKNRSLFGYARGHYTSVRAHFKACQINIIEDTNGQAKIVNGTLANGDQPIILIGALGTSIPSGVSWSDLIPIKPDFSNILTSMDTANL